MPEPYQTPRVFVSSTAEDLKEFREAAELALKDNDCHAILFEYWEGADNPALEECLKRVDGCHLVLALIAQRHGWTPPNQDKSITRLECERALQNNIEIIPFLADEKAWPVEKTEDYRATIALQESRYAELAQLGAEIQTHKTRLADFKTWLCENRQRKVFSNPEQLRRLISDALHRWRGEHPQFQQPHAVAGFDRANYRDWLRKRCESVELLGLDPKNANPVRLQNVYVPAMVSWDKPDLAYLQQLGTSIPADEADKTRLNIPLLHRLGKQSLYVPGDPGAGKSTFCRWLALTTALGNVPDHPLPTQEQYLERLPPSLQNRLPVLCYLRDLNDHKEFLQGSGHWHRKPLEDALAAWLDKIQPGGLTGSAWRVLMEKGDCLLILDGVDELQVLYHDAQQQAHRPRANILSGLADALPVWQQKHNRILLTSRPYGLSAAERQALGLEQADLQALDTPLQNSFIRRWFAAVDPDRAHEKAEGMIAHLAGRDDLTELRQSPMLLTGLCVKYDEDKRLPEDIHILYHTLISQVLHGRYHGTDQDAVRRRLAVVALDMHTGAAAGQARTSPEAAISYRELEQSLAAYAGLEPASEGGAQFAAEKREDLISRSGLLLPRGEEQAGFYHFSFQEFLAAERLQDCQADLAGYLRLYATTPDWRRTLMFLFCRVAEKRPQAALEAVREILLPQLELGRLQQNPDPALLLLDCLEIAKARKVSVQDFEPALKQACQHSLDLDFPAKTRNLLWLGAGKLGMDDRPGIGLDKDGLPDIVWCPVEAGRVRLEGEPDEFAVPPCQIAKHPVTNAQYQAFLAAADGYQNADWWEAEWLENHWVDLAMPFQPSWIEPTAPRETVSWHEAMAFCRWLDCKLREQGKLKPNQQIRLPTEWEWQMAATGGDGARIYPWGNKWDIRRLNAEFKLKRTSAVGIYPEGQALCGALDMAGNVWEWCLNAHEKPNDIRLGGDGVRVLRGGSWVLNQDLCRAGFRSGDFPGSRYYGIGFRLCLCRLPS